MKRFSVIMVIASLLVVFFTINDASGQVITNNKNQDKPVVSKSQIKSSDCQDFDTLAVGGYVALQLGGLWTTWSGLPGSQEDAVVSNNFFVSDSNSFVVNTNWVDLVYRFGEEAFSTGQWLYSSKIYVPSGYSGYFNVQSDPVPGVAWVMEVFFDDGGAGNFMVNGVNRSFTYPQDEWFDISIDFDLDSNLIETKLNDELLYWFKSTYSIGGIDYYGANSGGEPGAYYDNVCFEEGYEIIPLPPPFGLTGTFLSNYDVLLNWNPPLLDSLTLSNNASGNCDSTEIYVVSYNIYKSDEFSNGYEYLDNTTDTTYIDYDFFSPYASYKVTAVYNIGFESRMSNEAFLFVGVNNYNKNKLKVYPNPATDVVNVKSDEWINSVKVYNYAGQVIVNEEVNNMMYQLNTSQYQSGIYFFRIETDEGIISKKIIVQ